MVSIVIAILFISLLFNIPFARLKIPPIIGYIFTGIIITILFHLDKHTIETIAEMGIVFLMFLIGLEFSPDKLIAMKKEVMFGFLEMTFVSLAFGGVMLFFVDDFKVSLVIGGALALSSTAIVLKLLNENREISKPYGKIVLGILLFQDIAVIPILIAISIMTNKDAALMPLILKTLGGFLGLGLFIWIYGKYIAPFIIKHSVSTKSEEIFIATVLFVVLVAAEIAHVFGLSYSLGAFLAGMALSETKYKHQIEADLVPFRDILLGVFFISVGLMVDIKFVFHHIVSIVGLTIFVMALKFVVIYIMLRTLKVHKRVSAKSAISLAQIGEFAFVIFALLSQYHMLSFDVVQKLVVATVISMILTPFILNQIYKFADLFDKPQSFEEFELKPAEVKKHLILIGYDKIGQNVASKLTNLGVSYIAIDKQIEAIEEGIRRGDNVIFGNAAKKEVLQELNVEEAAAVIITTTNEMHTHMITQNILDINKDLNVVVVTNDEIEMEFYEDNKVHIVDVSKELAGKLIELALKCECNPDSCKS